MVLNRFNSGPQIHFWISEKVVSNTEPQDNNSDEMENPQTPDKYPQDVNQKDRGIPPYYHVEIF
jgi:hypothetical protein